ncbi:reverse transcriptase domain-containing protein [Alkalimarinus sediminis]|uniref:Reverse transcriptase domain-containing protein n=1 Tax=Alkalimarinus sediminis TaxID=1632866 RepID=A0A9E8HL34_9ALTE|nr:reverse transcriptase domain-containing protein [Alkalimarinus sediminis]UZW76605.1 reverse transcriptase domain-containing protein [Alkalimarinus sediminis]
MAQLLAKVVTPHNINKAWRRFDTDKTSWKPGVRVSDVARDMTYHLMTLAHEMEQGSYQPSALRRFTLVKANGKKRDIAALCLRDKVAQRAVLQVLEPIVEPHMHSDSFGFRPGRNTQMAYSRARTYVTEQRPWLVRADIEGFFDNILLSSLKRFLRINVNDQNLLILLFTWINAYSTTRARLWRRAKGLPQGGILSPLLGNWYLGQLDERLQKKKIKFIRYADDILLCCPSEAAAQKALNQLEKNVKKLGLRLNPDKTTIVFSNPKVIYLGHKMPKVKQ